MIVLRIYQCLNFYIYSTYRKLFLQIILKDIKFFGILIFIYDEFHMPTPARTVHSYILFVLV